MPLGVRDLSRRIATLMWRRTFTCEDLHDLIARLDHDGRLTPAA
jgi:hypothetical protein